MSETLSESQATASLQTASETGRPTWLARIEVTLKPVVLDPQGDAVLNGLHQLGFADVSSVRVGKYLEVTLAAESAVAAEAEVRQMCDRLLANPVIESYHCTVEARESRSNS